MRAPSQLLERQKRQQAHHESSAESDAKRASQRRGCRRQVRGSGDGHSDGGRRNDHAQHICQGRLEAHKVRQRGREPHPANGRHDHDRARSAQDGTKRDPVEPRPSGRKPAGVGRGHRGDGHRAAGDEETGQAQDHGARRGARRIAQVELAPPARGPVAPARSGGTPLRTPLPPTVRFGCRRH